MTDIYGEAVVIRTQSGEALSNLPDLEERLVTALTEAAIPTRPTVNGLAVPSNDRVAAERVIENPHLNREGAEIFLDLGPLGSNLP
jgi:hypothetical protein